MQLVISHPHLGLKHAIAAMFFGAALQRCRVHFMRNVLSRVPKASAGVAAAAVRSVFAQPDAAMLTDSVEDLVAFTGFPQAD